MTVKLNALTVDVEDYFHVSAFSDNIAPKDWGQCESRIEQNTEVLLELFQRYGARGTFFVLGWVAERHPALIRRIADLGHEIASHGYSHELVYRQTPDTFRAETARSKRVLEDILGKPVVGYRAASYSITAESLWALDILVDLGFKWDSSIFPVRHDLYGIPDAPRFPYLHQTEHKRSIIEFPLSTAEIMGQRIPIAGGGYFRLYPYALTQWGLRSINEAECPFIFYLHPWEIDSEQPKVEAGWFSRFRHYTNIDRCLPRLENLLSDFPFTTVSSVLQQEGLLKRRRS